MLVRGAARFGAGKIDDNRFLRNLLAVLALVATAAVLGAAYAITSRSAAKSWQWGQRHGRVVLGFLLGALLGCPVVEPARVPGVPDFP